MYLYFCYYQFSRRQIQELDGWMYSHDIYASVLGRQAEANERKCSMNERARLSISFPGNVGSEFCSG